jgi:hypothetical protein
MIQQRSSSSFNYYILCIIAYFLAIFTNEVFIKQGFQLMGISATEYEQIESYKFFGWMAGAVGLLLSIKSTSFKKIIFTCLAIYWFSVFNIIFVDIPYWITLLCIPFYSGTIVAMSSLLLSYSLSASKEKNIHSFFTYSIGIVVAYLLSEIFEYIKFDNGRMVWMMLISLNILLFGIFLVILTSSKAYMAKIDFDEYRFFPVLRRSELEILVIFAVFYCVMVMQYGYNVFAAGDSLVTLDPTVKKYFRLTAVVVAIIGANLYISRVTNKHKVNMVCILALMLLFVSINYWGKSLLFTILGRTGLIISAYILVIGGVLALAEKFRGVNLFNAVALYIMGASFGCYCGYKTIDVLEESIGVHGFLIAISFVLFSLLLYYLHVFIKNKLYR